MVDEQSHLASLQVSLRSEAFAVVRVRPGDLQAVSRYLDLGAPAIMMPNIRMPAEAAAFVAAAHYAPEGTRSSTGNALRAARYGIGPPLSSESPLLLAVIESRAALDNIAAIAATAGLDGFVIGHYDLAADLGCRNDFAAAAYRSAFTRIEKSAVSAGLVLGGSAHPGFPVKRLLSAGHRLIVASVDMLALRDGLRSHLAAAKAEE
jgi:2-keto-3-deoxy-L-rhamnonate aldolase RhmA